MAHRIGAYYQQHSCGAVREIIPSLIKAGVDILEPLQKVDGAIMYEY
jgi:uroporphyrinogen decarboxylase